MTTQGFDREQWKRDYEPLRNTLTYCRAGYGAFNARTVAARQALDAHVSVLLDELNRKEEIIKRWNEIYLAEQRKLQDQIADLEARAMPEDARERLVRELFEIDADSTVAMLGAIWDRNTVDDAYFNRADRILKALKGEGR